MITFKLISGKNDGENEGIRKKNDLDGVVYDDTNAGDLYNGDFNYNNSAIELNIVG
jgi:hypothetical protein